MEEMLDELIEAICSDPTYSNFKECEKKLPQEELLLIEYRRVLDEYQQMKQYAQHVDISSTKEKLKTVQKAMNESKIIQDYYAAYHQLNDFLSDLTGIIFQDLSEDLSTSPYQMKQVKSCG
ncbi:MAG: YlbF family regulator [Beduini sp.]|uniref:YlbF family regulator n=1 Tax=Beduini sp. TaxID=1922300 RepID=UPI0011CA6B62